MVAWRGGLGGRHRCIGRPWARVAAAVILAIQPPFARQAVGLGLASVLAPIRAGVGYADPGRCPLAGAGNLGEIFISRNPQHRIKTRETVGAGVKGCLVQPEEKALIATAAAFGLGFQAADGLAPGFGIVGKFDKRHAEGLANALILVAAAGVFGGGLNIRIIKQHGKALAGRVQVADHADRTRRATRKQQ